MMGPKTPILIIRAPIVGKRHSHPQEDGKAKDAKPKAVSRRSVSFGGLFSEGRSWFKGGVGVLEFRVCDVQGRS